MSRWFHSLHFRILLLFIFVLALSLTAVSMYVSYAAKQQTNDFRQAADRARAHRMESVLSHYYATHGHWSGLDPQLRQAGDLYGWRIVVRDSQGNVVADSRPIHSAPPPPSGPNVQNLSLTSGGQVVGSAVIDPATTFVAPPDPPISNLVSAINRSLIWIGLAAAAGGVLFVSLTTRRMLAPLTALREGASRLGRGDLAHRVEVGGANEIRDLGHVFNSMAEDLEDAEQHRRHLMADVAHELRTPLSNIQGYLEAIRDGVLAPDPTTIDTIHNQVLHLTRLVEDLRLIALAEAGALHLHLEPDSLSEVLQRSVVAFQPRADLKKVGLSLRVQQDLPLVTMDRTRIAQAVENLLENAITHTPEGGAVAVSAESVGSVARVTVSDTGPGIPPEDLDHLFDRFYRVDRSRTRATGGAGLGLTIAKQLVEAHHGTIRVVSVLGHGSEFTIELPLAASLGSES